LKKGKPCFLGKCVGGTGSVRETGPGGVADVIWYCKGRNCTGGRRRVKKGEHGALNPAGWNGLHFRGAGICGGKKIWGGGMMSTCNGRKKTTMH